MVAAVWRVRTTPGATRDGGGGDVGGDISRQHICRVYTITRIMAPGTIPAEHACVFAVASGSSAKSPHRLSRARADSLPMTLVQPEYFRYFMMHLRSARPASCIIVALSLSEVSSISARTSRFETEHERSNVLNLI